MRPDNLIPPVTASSHIKFSSCLLRAKHYFVVSLVPDEAIAYQQALADEFYDLKIVPKKLNVADIVWCPKAS